MELWTAFALGLGGSLHCVGMCGPLALALPGGRGGTWGFAVGRLLYNGGRIVTYAALGGLFGLLGGFLHWGGMQQALSVVLGIGLLLSGLWWLVRWPVFTSVITTAMGVAALKRALGGLLQQNTRYALLLIGMVNGLLPCGLVCFALAGSLAAGGPLRGMAYMAVFGSATLPLMLAIVLMGRLVRPERWRFLRQFAPMGMVLLGILLVLRGLALDIPFVSPILQGDMARHH
jgi:hypothetical protein